MKQCTIAVNSVINWVFFSIILRYILRKTVQKLACPEKPPKMQNYNGDGLLVCPTTRSEVLCNFRSRGRVLVKSGSAEVRDAGVLTGKKQESKMREKSAGQWVICGSIKCGT